MTILSWLIAATVAAVPARAVQKPDSIKGEILRPTAQGPERLNDVRIVLHRISPAKQGPIDSFLTAESGRFRFRFTRDSAAIYLVSARWAGIEYFSDALTQPGAANDVRLMVFDTSSSAVARTRNRTLVVQAPDETGVREVLDWLVIENPGDRTRVGRDSVTATWSAPLPAGVEGPGISEMQASPFASDAVLFRRDSVFVTAPLSPGTKELWLRYRIPAGAKDLELSSGKGDSIDLFVEEIGAEVEGGEWKEDTMTVTDRRFQRYAGRSEGPVTISFPGVDDPAMALRVAVVSFVVFLGFGTWYLLRRPPRSSLAGSGPRA